MLEFETAGTMKDRWARPCDASSVYCRSDLAYLCNVRIHEHERVWVCESCERAPAAFLCKADCDADIHSANPIQPIPTSVYCPNLGGDMMTPELAENEDEEAWLLVNPMNNGEEEASFGDEYLDLDEYNEMSLSEGYSCKCNNQQHYGGDSIVPIPIKYEEVQLGYTAITNYPPSISQQTVSISWMDVGIVPESASHTSSVRAPKGTIDALWSPLHNEGAATQDREARVMRYREKKKTRKFDKTIRYASRKAYAETRPRIKGRFAKRRGQLQVDDHQIFSSQSLMSSDAAYGVVPSF